MRAYSAHRGRHNGFTLVEVLVIIGIIAVLMALLLPALTGAKKSAQMAKSQNHMKQIATWMRLYSSENRETVLPSQFDYTASANSGYPVKVRSHSTLGANRYKGTWSDILWTANGLGENAGTGANIPAEFEFDSPDKSVYDGSPNFDDNVFRAGAINTRDFFTGNGVEGAKPFGDGAAESGYAGFFAANNFFNADPAAPLYDPTMPTPGTLGRWYTMGQIKAPDRSMYLVDSLAGETIDPIAAPFDNDPAGSAGTCEVDFRYVGNCLILFLDGHVDPQGAWIDLNDVQQQRRIRVQRLDRN